jgi:hypothetical protein
MTFLCHRGREHLRQMTRDTFKINTDGTGRKFVMQVCKISVIKCRLIVKINKNVIKCMPFTIPPVTSRNFPLLLFGVNIHVAL